MTMTSMNAGRGSALGLVCIVVTFVALPRECSASDSDNCITCLIMNLLSYNQLLRDPVRLFGALQNQIVYNNLCRAFENTMYCFDHSECTQEHLDVLNSQYRWPVLRIMLNEICSTELQPVLPSYCRNCYMQPSVTACISSYNFWMTHLPQDDEAICRQIEYQVNFNRCIDDSTQSLCDPGAVALIRRLSAPNEADTVPPEFSVSSCRSTAAGDEWNWSDGARSAANTLEQQAMQPPAPAYVTTYPETSGEVTNPVEFDAGTRSAHSCSYILIPPLLLLIFFNRKIFSLY